jgi:prolipoprotein diacylglyceryltransferase
MQLLIIILAISLIVFLFCLHVLAKEDLIFVRKNITMEILFNIAFYTIGIGLLCSRIVYVIEHFSIGFLNPLVFFLFPYFPGLSLAGGVGGALLFTLLYRAKKYPNGRIFDFFSMAFLAALPVGFLGQGLLLGMRDRFSGIFMPIIFLITLIFFVKILLPLNTRGEIEDGSLGFLFVVVFSLTTLISLIVRANNFIGLVMQLDVILLVILLIFSIIMLLVKEKHISLKKPNRGDN